MMSNCGEETRILDRFIIVKKNDSDSVRGGGRGSESYDRNYHK